MADLIFECPHCSKHYVADSGLVGSLTTCTDCSQDFLIPPLAPAKEVARNTSTTKTVLRWLAFIPAGFLYLFVVQLLFSLGYRYMSYSMSMGISISDWGLAVLAFPIWCKAVIITPFISCSWIAPNSKRASVILGPLMGLFMAQLIYSSFIDGFPLFVSIIHILSMALLVPGFWTTFSNTKEID